MYLWELLLYFHVTFNFKLRENRSNIMCVCDKFGWSPSLNHINVAGLPALREMSSWSQLCFWWRLRVCSCCWYDPSVLYTLGHAYEKMPEWSVWSLCLPSQAFSCPLMCVLRPWIELCVWTHTQPTPSIWMPSPSDERVQWEEERYDGTCKFQGRNCGYRGETHTVLTILRYSYLGIPIFCYFVLRFYSNSEKILCLLGLTSHKYLYRSNLIAKKLNKPITM